MAGYARVERKGMDDKSFLTDSLERVADALRNAGVDYALAGGLAFSALVEPRATVDIDLLVLCGDSDQGALARALAPLFDALIPHQTPMVFAKASIWRVVGIKGQRELLIGFLMGDSDFHRQALRRKLIVDFHGHKVPIVTLEDLYLLKHLAGRPQDIVDIGAIERKRASELDRDYLDGWLNRWAAP